MKKTLPHTVSCNIIILGATGAVGTEVIRNLSSRPDVAVTALTRRPLTENFNTNIATHIVDPLDPKTYAEILSGHKIAICTLGVGQPTKVSPQ
jgi:putative NADH-flavin reductase